VVRFKLKQLKILIYLTLNYLLLDCQMKIDRLETYDRLLEFSKQADYISQGCSECIRNRPYQFTMPFYIFAHSRTIEIDERISIFDHDVISSHIDPLYVRKYRSLADVPTARLIWSPRLSKPIPQPNSMLFRAFPPSESVQIFWMLPAKELWEQYEKGLMLQNKEVIESIHMFKNDYARMAAPEIDDLPEDVIQAIYKDIARTYGDKWKIIE
jgi:hypothetical protein